MNAEHIVPEEDRSGKVQHVIWESLGVRGCLHPCALRSISLDVSAARPPGTNLGRDGLILLKSLQKILRQTAHVLV